MASLTLSAEDLAKLQASSEKLARALGGKKTKSHHDIELQVTGPGGHREKVALPAAAFEMFVHMLAQMASGHSITLVPSERMLTTQQAADLLKVSRPFVVSLIDDGRIPSVRMRSHRRIRLTDLLAYKQKIDADADAAMHELVRLSEKLGLYEL